MTIGAKEYLGHWAQYFKVPLADVAAYIGWMADMRPDLNAMNDADALEKLKSEWEAQQRDNVENGTGDSVRHDPSNPPKWVD